MDDRGPEGGGGRDGEEAARGPATGQPPRTAPRRDPTGQPTEPAALVGQAEVRTGGAGAGRASARASAGNADGPRAAPVRSRLRRWLGLAGWLVALVLGALVLEILVYRFVTPVETPAMKVARLMGEPVRQTWVPLERISPRLAKAVIASEDAHFCRHHGIDLGEVRAALRDALDGNPRGASTITMQVAKNLLLWPGRNVVRKALEVPLALVLDLVWPKARILETYLNIAEWGPGIYGIEAASQRAFGKPAADLSESEAARLAVVLPAPSLRNARFPSSHHQRVAQVVAARVRNGVNTTCLGASRALPED